MTLFTPYSQALATFLTPLLDEAQVDPISAFWLPSRFNVAGTFTTPGGISWGTQGLVVSATTDLNGQTTPVGILAFGTRWDDYLYGSTAQNYTISTSTPGYLNLSGSQSLKAAPGGEPSTELADALQRLTLSLSEVDHLAGLPRSGARDHPLVDLARSGKTQAQARSMATLDAEASATGRMIAWAPTMYAQARAAIWQGVASLYSVPGLGARFPLICVGLGPAAAMAQMAALDLRPGQTGPSGASQVSPVTEICCYAFSAAPLGDTTFASAAITAVPALYTVNATSVDPWPSTTGLVTGVDVVGESHPLSVSVPSDRETPWYTRTGSVYAQGLGQGTPAATGTGTLSGQGAGFDTAMASAQAQLAAITYVTSLNPGGTVAIPSPYTAEGSVTAKSTEWVWMTLPWINLYKNTLTKSLIISLRGPGSIGETGAVNGGGYGTRPSWTSNGRIGSGILELADSLVAPLVAALPSDWTPSSIYYSGHDFGAAVACCLAYRAQTGSAALPKPTGIYGYGCQPFGDYAFVNQVYAPELGSITFQIQRPSDILTHRTGSGFTYVAGQPAVLDGGEGTTANGATYHAAALYSQLMTGARG
ncbi:MAG: lipase family protein [Rhodospirillum sp.]|nr:lipase family protein [Rhodospirillum sp.]MCF8492171.1 lipase family protein [Rhodospirillum sp.]MCF8503265.1 lipase family protein [Rhodospirillum sp.]